MEKTRTCWNGLNWLEMGVNVCKWLEMAEMAVNDWKYM